MMPIVATAIVLSFTAVSAAQAQTRSDEDAVRNLPLMAMPDQVGPQPANP